MTTTSFKCEICGREGNYSSFKVCPKCNRLIGKECWDTKEKKKDEHSGCEHRLEPPVIDKTSGIFIRS